MISIKNATDLSVIPNNVKDGGLAIAYDEANRGTWTPDELEEYLKASMKRGDEKNALAFAKEEGIEEGKEIGLEIGLEEGKEIGIEEGKEIGEMNKNISVIITGFKNGLPISMLSVLTNMTEQEVENILKENGLL
jgi:flagellar biosynthesis/type III secretory pathway protein FliH